MTERTNTVFLGASVRSGTAKVLAVGLISSVFDLLTFAVLLLVFHANERIFQTSWFMISLLTQLAVVLVLRTHRPALRSVPSRLLLWSTIAAATYAIPLLGGPATAFGFVPLTAFELRAVIAIVLGYTVATEVAKVRFFRSETSLRPRTGPS